MPQKRHFNPALYKAVAQSCRLLRDLTFILIPLEEKRISALLQPHCEDLNKSNCPEYYETHQKIFDLIKDYQTEEDKIFKPYLEEE